MAKKGGATDKKLRRHHLKKKPNALTASIKWQRKKLQIIFLKNGGIRKMKKDERKFYFMEYIEKVIENSWTWDRLTEAEKKRFLKSVCFNDLQYIGNSKKDCYFIIANIYNAFLDGIGYKPTGWRKKENEPLF